MTKDLLNKSKLQSNATNATLSEQKPPGHTVIQVNADKDIVIHDQAPPHNVKIPQAMDATSKQAPESLAMYT